MGDIIGVLLWKTVIQKRVDRRIEIGQKQIGESPIGGALRCVRTHQNERLKPVRVSKDRLMHYRRTRRESTQDADPNLELIEQRKQIVDKGLQ